MAAAFHLGRGLQGGTFLQQGRQQALAEHIGLVLKLPEGGAPERLGLIGGDDPIQRLGKQLDQTRASFRSGFQRGHRFLHEQ